MGRKLVTGNDEAAEAVARCRPGHRDDLMAHEASEVAGVGDLVRQPVENGLRGDRQPCRIGSGVQEPQQSLAEPIIPALSSVARDQVRLLQVLEKAMRGPNRQIATLRDLGNATSIYRCSDAL